jgi:hypothetical protein
MGTEVNPVAAGASSNTAQFSANDLDLFLQEVNWFQQHSGGGTPVASNPGPTTGTGTPSGTGTTAKDGFSGHGSINGDPHYAWTSNGANGTSGTEQKWDHQGKDGHYYEVLKDKGIDVIDQYGRYSDNANVVKKTGISFNGNQLEVDSGGHVELNGQTLKDGTYLNGQVVVDHGTVEVKADNYDIKIHDQGDHLDTDFTADNAGSSSDKPTGILGSAISNPSAKVDGDSFEVKGLFDGSKPATGTSGGTVNQAEVIAFLQDLQKSEQQQLDMINQELKKLGGSSNSNSDSSSNPSSTTASSGTTSSGSVS